MDRTSAAIPHPATMPHSAPTQPATAPAAAMALGDLYCANARRPSLPGKPALRILCSATSKTDPFITFFAIQQDLCAALTQRLCLFHLVMGQPGCVFGSSSWAGAPSPSPVLLPPPVLKMIPPELTPHTVDVGKYANVSLAQRLVPHSLVEEHLQDALCTRREGTKCLETPMQVDQPLAARRAEGT